MAATRMPPAEDGLARYLQSVRARAMGIYAARAASAALGVGLACLVVAAAAVGPVVSAVVARAVLGALLLLALGAALAAAWPARTLRGLGGTRLVLAREPRVGSALRSALELRDAGSLGSPELMAAHAQSVERALSAIPASEVVPLRWLRHGTVIAGVCASLLGGALLFGHDDVRLGALALLDPAELRKDGVRVGPVIASVRARLIYPSYIGLAPLDLAAPTTLQAPRGTTVELTIEPRIAARDGLLLLGAAPTRMSAAPNGKLFARFVVRQDGPLVLRLHDAGTWYEDATARRVDALEDQRPKIKLESSAGRTVEASDPIPLSIEASDDHGLEGMDLMWQVEGADAQRRVVWTPGQKERPALTVKRQMQITAAECGAQPGDVLTVWLEARDSDTVSGPNVGSSPPLTFEVATDAQQISLLLPHLREVLDRALDALADRLEIGMPDSAPQAATRADELRPGVETWLATLETLIKGTREQEAESTLDLDQLQGVLDRARRELARETGLGRGAARPLNAFTEADARIVSEHERDVLILADLLAQGLVDEAQALAKELKELKGHIKALLQQLKQKKSPEAMRALLAEIQKAQRRMQELAQSLSRLSTRVPSEFINREALPQNEAGNALDDLQKAVEAGDMESAEKMLEELSKQLDAMSAQLEKGGARFRESHGGARERAREQARSQLSMLAAEQGRLAERTNEMVDQATERATAQSGAGKPSPAMQGAADALAKDLQSLAQGAGPEGPWLDRGQERMRDAADALRTGDLSEARRMAEHARDQLEHAANSLEQDARMFPGAQGQTAERAGAAREAARKLGELGQQLDRAMPDVSSQIGEGERGQMRGDVTPQRTAREKAEELRAKLGQLPEQGSPLSPTGEQGLAQATEAMRRAEKALERGDAKQASLAQDTAREQLEQVAKQMERKPGKGSPGGSKPDGSEEGEGDGEGDDPRAPVRIPGAEEFSGPKEQRRRLLDAMREAPPGGFETAVQRYYQELLR